LKNETGTELEVPHIFFPSIEELGERLEEYQEKVGAGLLVPDAFSSNMQVGTYKRRPIGLGLYDKIV